MKKEKKTGATAMFLYHNPDKHNKNNISLLKIKRKESKRFFKGMHH